MHWALGVPARVVCGFLDRDVNELLALDADREVALALVSFGTDRPAPPPHEVPEVHFRFKALSTSEVDYPVMRSAHAASSLANPDEAADWRRAAVSSAPARDHAGDSVPLANLAAVPPDSIEEVIPRRGSSRRFAHKPITFAELSTVLRHAGSPVDADFVEPGAMLNELYVIANAVEGLPAGAYYYNVAAQRLDVLKYGLFRREAAFLDLEQDLAGDAAAAIFFLCDLDRVLERLGNRGYRAVQFEAGIAGGRIYLAAYALRMGATGLTFYDDEVTHFFSPHAAGKSAVFLVAVGHV
jgi:SagB-type dehydrogenase family enzyme